MSPTSIAMSSSLTCSRSQTQNQKTNTMLKKSRTESSDAPREGGEPQLRENAQVNAKIDEYIKANPKHWDYIQSLPPERMARALVLNEVQKQERTQKMREGIVRKLEQDPELKQAYQNLVKNLPEDQREQAMINIAARTMRDLTPKETQKAGVKV